MTVVHSGLAALSSTVRLLPRDPMYGSVHVAFTGECADPALRTVISLVGTGDIEAAHDAALTLEHALGDLVRGITALQVGDESGAIAPLSSLLATPPLGVVPGVVLLAPSDETMLVCDINAAAAVPLLVFALAASNRYGEAIEVAGAAHQAAGAEGFLWLQLWLLRDEKRWEELVTIADSRDSHSSERLAIEFLRAEALEALGRDDDARREFAALAALEADLTWISAARERLNELEAREPGISEPPEAVDIAIAGEVYGEAAAFDPLRSKAARPETTDLLPVLDPPDNVGDRLNASRSVCAVLSIDGPVTGKVTVRGVRGPRAELAPATWLCLLEDRRITEVLDDLDDAIAAPVPLVGIRRRPDEDVAKAKHWQTALAALLATAADEDDAAERLTSALNDSQTRWWIDRADDWFDAIVTTSIGDVTVATAAGPESFVLPLVAKLHASGASAAAVIWLEWLKAKRYFPAAMYARVSIAYDLGEDSDVLVLTDGTSGTDADQLVLRSFRARSLARSGRLEPALTVLAETIRAARRLDDDGDLERELRYVRAHVAYRAGKLGQALEDLASIIAVDSSLYDASDMYERLSRPVGNVRGALSLAVKRAVYERYGGACANCSSRFDLQYDHIIPVAMGGATSFENLQLLCGDCNRKKGATLG